MPGMRFDYIYGTKEFIERFRRQLKELLTRCSHGQHFEKLRCPGNVYSCRINLSDRLLFTIGKINGKSSLIVLDFVENHEYQKSKFIRQCQVLPSDFDVNPTEAEQQVEISEDKPDSCFECKPIYYINETQGIILDTEQEKISTSDFPLIITGPAGSGKTSAAFAQLISLPSRKNNMETGEIEQVRCLYVSAEKRLVKSIETEWLAVCTQSSEFPLVEFKTHEELVQSCIPKDLKLVEKEHTFDWIINNNTKPKTVKEQKGLRKTSQSKEDQIDISNINPEIIYQEFILIAALNNDLINYQSLGVRQASINQEHRKLVHDLYIKYKNYLDGEKLVHKFLHTEIGQHTNQYDFVVIDEAQLLGLAPCEFIRQHAIDNQVCICCDTLQSVGERSWFDLLRSLFQNANVITLEQQYRSPSNLIPLLNRIIKARQLFIGGKSHSHEAMEIPDVAEPAGEAISFINQSWCNENGELITQWCSVSKFAVIFSPTSDNIELERDAIKEIFNTPLVLTRREAQGLEYEDVLFFEPFDKRAEEIQRWLFNKGYSEKDILSLQASPSRSADKTFVPDLMSVSWFNDVYSVLTRSAKDIIVYTEHLNKEKFNILSTLLTGKSSTKNKIPLQLSDRVDEQGQFATPASITDDEKQQWRLEANKQYKIGNTKVAEDIYAERLKGETPPWVKKNHRAQEQQTTTNISEKPQRKRNEPENTGTLKQGIEQSSSQKASSADIKQKFSEDDLIANQLFCEDLFDEVMKYIKDMVKLIYSDETKQIELCLRFTIYVTQYKKEFVQLVKEEEKRKLTEQILQQWSRRGVEVFEDVVARFIEESITSIIPPLETSIKINEIIGLIQEAFKRYIDQLSPLQAAPKFVGRIKQVVSINNEIIKNDRFPRDFLFSMIKYVSALIKTKVVDKDEQEGKKSTLLSMRDSFIKDFGCMMWEERSSPLIGAIIKKMDSFEDEIIAFVFTQIYKERITPEEREKILGEISLIRQGLGLKTADHNQAQNQSPRKLSP